MISYGVKETPSANAFVVMIHNSYLLVFANGEKSVNTFNVQDILDGNFHLLCVTWEKGGFFQVYADGFIVYTGAFTNQGKNFLPGGGVLVFGQDQDTVGGGFDASQSYKGIVTDITMSSTVLPPTEISSMATTCYNLYGDLISWDTQNFTLVGNDVFMERPSTCLLIGRNPEMCPVNLQF